VPTRRISRAGSADYLLTEQRFIEYLDSTGHKSDVGPVTAEFDAIKKVDAVAGSAAGLDTIEFAPFKAITVYWLAGSLVVAMIGWLAFIATAAGIGGRWGRRTGKAAAKLSLLWKIVVGILVVCGAAVFTGTFATAQGNTIASAIKGLDLIANNTQRGILDPEASYGGSFGACIILPSLLCMCIAAIVARRRKAPLLPAVSHAATLIACLLVFIYAGLILATVSADRSLENVVTKTWFHEVSSMADAAGVALPPPTVWPANP
jgi:hypothetical protein